LARIISSPDIIRRYIMDNWTFGITMIIVGMGGTLLTLWILSLIMSLLKKLLPYSKEEEK
jgi:Na+-transporting methylmalonyl-CoA/oxaloacetate decarboxylase gamma subunit